jgi:2-dehydropantoate 2-reductase
VHIAVIGPGAVGSTIAAWLMQSVSNNVVVAARSPLADIEVQSPERMLNVRPHVITRIEDASRVDWILIATKAYDAEAAGAWLRRLADQNTVVAVLQNGVEHVERFEAHFPADRILPVMVDLPAERRSAGRVLQRRNGRMVVPEGVSGARFVELFAHTPIEVLQTSDFKSEVWRKLCVNAAGALSAIMLQPAVIARHDGVARIMESIIRECIAVGRAEGASLDDSIPQNVIEGYRKSPDSINSIHADRLAGREMEIDARNGVIVRLGRKHGIATPVNQMVVALLEAASGSI